MRNRTEAIARRKRRSPGEIMDRILQASADEFKRAGFAGATTASIARAADVTEAQLFRYFASKAELFHAAIFEPLNRHFCDFQARHVSDATEAEGVRDLAGDYISELQQFIGDHSQMLMSLVVAQAYARGSTQGMGEIESLGDYFDRGATMMARRVEGAPVVDPRLMVRVSFAAVLGCVLFKDWIFPPGLANEAEIGAAIKEFVIDGISANTDPGLAPTTPYPRRET